MRRTPVPVEFGDKSKGMLVFVENIGDSEANSGSLLWIANLTFDGQPANEATKVEQVVVKIVPSFSGDAGFVSSSKAECHFIKYVGEIKEIERNVVPLWGYTPCKYSDLRQFMPYVLEGLGSLHDVFDADEMTLLVVEKVESNAHDYIKSCCRKLERKQITSQQFDNAIKPIIFQVLYTLDILKKRDPTFLHNDLHLSNILLKWCNDDANYDYEGKMFVITPEHPSALLWDFGYSSSKTVQNWDAETLDEKWGVKTFADGDCPYDVHLFLNSIHLLFESKEVAQTTQTASWIRSVIPGKLRGKHGDHLYQGRLTSATQEQQSLWSSIPSIRTMLTSHYFRSLQKRD